MQYLVSYYGFECPCGCKPSGVKVGISSLGDLVAEWVCNKCKCNCLVRKPLAECVDDIPPHPTPNLTAEDHELMKGMCIAYE